MITFIDKGQDFEKSLSVLVIFEYNFFIVTPIGDVIYGTGIFYA
jgi:hypothetical protein